MNAKRFSIQTGTIRALMLGVALGPICTASRAAPSTNQTVEVDTASGPHVFKVSLMATDAEREKGLMFVKAMPKDEGMLFDFHQTQPIMMWMKDTLLPLDMVFIAADGRVVNIAHDAQPEDETIIPSKTPALGVLEINGGAADAIGLKIGDIVRHPIFHDAAAR